MLFKAVSFSVDSGRNAHISFEEGGEIIGIAKAVLEGELLKSFVSGNQILGKLLDEQLFGILLDSAAECLLEFPRQSGGIPTVPLGNLLPSKLSGKVILHIKNYRHKRHHINGNQRSLLGHKLGKNQVKLSFECQTVGYVFFVVFRQPDNLLTLFHAEIYAQHLVDIVKDVTAGERFNVLVGVGLVDVAVTPDVVKMLQRYKICPAGLQVGDLALKANVTVTCPNNINCVVMIGKMNMIPIFVAYEVISP